jgi:glycosyltransferase involved in cell wall biosynthesis
LRIFVLGTRGFPDIQGGVEQHCENLYPLLASSSCLITVFRRKPYVTNKEKTFNNISFIDLPSTKISGFETFFHSFLSTVVCIVKRPDIVHIHNIGPGFFVPFLKIAGLKVIMTYHSPNYEHVKWSRNTKYLLRFSEALSIRYSDKVIFVSSYQKDKLGNKPKFVHINNGVNIYPLRSNDDYIQSLGLQKRNYILSVGRLVQEKGFDLLIRAFSKSIPKGTKLVIAGGADHDTPYSLQLKELAKKHGIVLSGFVKGEKLQELYSHARLYVMASYNEGLPIALLEAMSYHLPIVASDIPANLQVALSEDSYFISGDEQSLTGKIDQALNREFAPGEYDMTPYSWSEIVEQTRAVYEDVVKHDN